MHFHHNLFINLNLVTFLERVYMTKNKIVYLKKRSKISEDI